MTSLAERVDDLNRRVAAAHLAHCNGAVDDSHPTVSGSGLLANQRVWSLFSTGHIMNECGAEIKCCQPRKHYCMEKRELNGLRLLQHQGLAFRFPRNACNDESYAYLTQQECTAFRAEMATILRELLVEATQQLNRRVQAAHHAHYAANPGWGLVNPALAPNENQIHHLYTDGSVTYQKGGEAYGHRNQFPLSNCNELYFSERLPFEFVVGSRKQYAVLTESECKSFREEMRQLLM
jgi:alpha-L-fucosidase